MSHLTQHLKKEFTNDESNSNALKGAFTLPMGGGIRSITAFNTSSTPPPVFADMEITSAGSMPKVACICAATLSGWAAGKSIYLIS
jgi:hypothetical protein